jgi:very-short-patch-repair endonuclease
MSGLACRAGLWYNKPIKLLRSSGAGHTPDREHNLSGGYAMDTLSPHTLDGNPMRTIQDANGQIWWVARDVFKILGYADKGISELCQRLSEDGVSKQHIATHGGFQYLLCVNENGLRKLIATSQKPNAIDIAHSLGIEVGTRLYSTKEQHTLAIISAAFSHIKQIHQYTVGDYRIDLYFPDYRIAVECDEQGHRHKRNADIHRQQFLEETLQCVFVRYNPDSKNFNIGNAINQIMRIILQG